MNLAEKAKQGIELWYLTKFDVYEVVFELFQKLYLHIYAGQFMTSNYFTSSCPFELGKCGKKGKKNTIVFERLSFSEKIKIC